MELPPSQPNNMNYDFYDERYYKDDPEDLKVLLRPFKAGSGYRIANLPRYNSGALISVDKMREIFFTQRRIPDYPDYWISENGKIWRLTLGGCSKYGRTRPHELEAHTNKTGYKSVGIDKTPARSSRNVAVHRLVVTTYFGPAPCLTDQCRHLDGIVSNNHYTNLAWGSLNENMDDASWHARVGKGNSESVRPEIRELIRNRVLIPPFRVAPLRSAD